MGNGESTCRTNDDSNNDNDSDNASNSGSDRDNDGDTGSSRDHECDCDEGWMALQSGERYAANGASTHA